MTVLYIHLDYEAYKALEDAAKAWKETQHTTTPAGFYHKSVRLPIGPGTIIEFHGPLVGGAGHDLPLRNEKPGLTFKDGER